MSAKSRRRFISRPCRSSECVRTLDVYVGNDTDADGYGLKIENYVLYDGEVTGAPKAGEPGEVDALDSDKNITAADANDGVEGSEKSEGYINSYDTSNISFGKRVEGNQGSKDKYFKFTVKITKAIAGTVYDVDLSNASVTVADTDATDDTYVGQTNTDKITVPDGATEVSVDFYLQHGQSITIKGLAKDTKYTVTEVNEDYAAQYSSDFASDETATGLENLKTYLINGTNAQTLTAGSAIPEQTIESTDLENAFLNTRKGILPTGIIMSVAPVVVVGIGVLAAIVALFISSKRRELEE